MENNTQVHDFYEYYYDEDAREHRQPLEFIRTKDIISRYLTSDNMKIADICGASGAYAYWLARQGHEVHLLDLSEKHIAQARINGEKQNLALASIMVGDARSLPYPSETFDLALVMGALYHLQEQNDRLRCIKEAYRVLKRGGIAIFTYISRYASLIDGLRLSFIKDQDFVSILDHDLQTGMHANPTDKTDYFTTSFFHTPGLITSELQEGGFPGHMLYAVEGIANVLTAQIDMDTLLKYIKAIETAPELLGVSSHIVAACNKA